MLEAILKRGKIFLKISKKCRNLKFHLFVVSHPFKSNHILFFILHEFTFLTFFFYQHYSRNQTFTTILLSIVCLFFVFNQTYSTCMNLDALDLTTNWTNSTLYNNHNIQIHMSNRKKYHLHVYVCYNLFSIHKVIFRYIFV